MATRMFASIDGTAIAIAVSGVLAFGGVVYGAYATQRARRKEAADRRWTDTAASRVQDSKNALDAWMTICAANTNQIAGLTARVDALQKQVNAYEAEVVPRLERTIEDQAETLAECVRVRTEHEKTIATLLERIRRLEESP